MSRFSIELIMSEFGVSRKNCGGARLYDRDRLNPTIDSFRKIYPMASITMYTDLDKFDYPGVSVINVIPPFSSESSRYGWRAHDYYQSFGMLQSKADIAIAMDSDMLIVSDGFSVITEFAYRFGLAVPINPRLLVKIDGEIGVDSNYIAELDETRGLGLTYNLTPIAFYTKHDKARQLLENYCNLMVKNPGRGAVHLSKASFDLGYQPFVLPPQWCVCSPRDFDSKHIWKEAIVLHVGHIDVLPRWKKEKIRVNFFELFNKIRKG